MPSQPDWRRGRPQDREWTPARDWPASSPGGSPFGGRPYVDGQPAGDGQQYGHSQEYGAREYGRGQQYGGAPYPGQPYPDQPGTGQDPRQPLDQGQPEATRYLQPGGSPSGQAPFGDAPFPGDPYPASTATRGGPGSGYPGGPDDPGGGRRPGRRWPRIALSIAAVALVVAGLGAYGVARMHHSAALTAVQDSAGRPCASQGQASGTGRACAASGAAASGAASSPAASASSSARPRHHKKHHHPATPTPTPTPTSTPKPHPAPSSSAPSGTSSGSAAAQVLSLINQARAQDGLPAYTISSGLDTSSRRHTKVMASGCGLSHQCPGEASLGDRLTAAGVQWSAAGENIGEGGPEPDDSADIAKMAVGLTQSMLDEKPPDDGHRLNILSSSFHHIGIYVFRDSHGTVWMTQDFSN
jgi:uncharacterized protein YkwD